MAFDLQWGRSSRNEANLSPQAYRERHRLKPGLQTPGLS